MVACVPRLPYGVTDIHVVPLVSHEAYVSVW